MDYAEYLQGFQELNLELKRRFDTEGISFAFPTQTLHLRKDSEQGAATRGSRTTEPNS